MPHRQADSAPFILVVGNGRSGTSLMARILSRSPEVAYFTESHFFEQLVKGGRYRFPEDLQRVVNKFLTIEKAGIFCRGERFDFSREGREIEARLAARGEGYGIYDVIRQCLLLRAEQQGKRLTGDQTPRHLFYIDDIVDGMPDARFALMQRDARDVLLSQKKKWRASRRRNNPLAESLRVWCNYHPITFSMIWRQGARAGAEALSRHDGLIKAVSFEDLTSRPGDVVREVCRFLGVSYRDEMLDVGIRSSSNVENEPASGISARVTGHWRTGLNAGEKWWTAALCGRDMRALGYRVGRPGFPPPVVLLQALTFPLKLALAVLLNIGRMGNPITFIADRIRLSFSK